MSRQRLRSDWAEDVASSILEKHAKSFQIEIRDELMVLPIPTRSLPSNFINTEVSIKNQKEIDQWFRPMGLLPELFDSAMQPVSCRLAQPSPYSSYGFPHPQCYKVHPQPDLQISGMHFRCVWSDEQLNLEIWNTYIWSDRICCATFEQLQPGDYSLRFKYGVPSESDWKLTDLASQFMTLRLAQPLGLSPSIVDIDGVQFKLLVPEQVVIPSPKQSKDPTAIEFRLQVHNASAMPHRFLLFDLKPNLQDSTGKEIGRTEYSRRISTPKQADFKLLLPGEHTEVVIKGEFCWRKNDLSLEGWASSGEHWEFYDFTRSEFSNLYDIVTGEYWLSVTYDTSKLQQFREYCRDELQSLYQDIWQGNFSTPPKKLEVIRT